MHSWHHSLKSTMTQTINIQNILANFVFEEDGKRSRTLIEEIEIAGQTIPKFINEFWTSRQRQAHSLHEVSYRACFKPQLPRFFIERLTHEGDVVYDPFSGRGTTIIEAALLGRNIIANDVNPLSALLSRPRLYAPTTDEVAERLEKIPLTSNEQSEIDLSMFFHQRTLNEIIALRSYLSYDRQKTNPDPKDASHTKYAPHEIDSWIQMVATNRLTGHSNGFFSVYTLPPNQATSAVAQKKINAKRNQQPEYRNVRTIILKKTKQLLKDLDIFQMETLRTISKHSQFLTNDARDTKKIDTDSVQLTVTSPPFLNVVQYAQDNWLRCWFNGIDAEEVGKSITMSKTIEQWCGVMRDVFRELFRITKKDGWVAFEVGEVRNGKVKLDEYVVHLGLDAGFSCEGIMINQQQFTKTANIWGVSNNSKGTNSNRIVIFRK